MRFLRHQFLQDGDLPFSDILSEKIILQALAAIGACWLDRIYSPLVTLWVFLGPVQNQVRGLTGVAVTCKRRRESAAGGGAEELCGTLLNCLSR